MREEYFFPPPADARSPFRLHLAGSSYCDETYRLTMNPWDLYYVLEYVERGRGHLIIDDTEYFPKTGDVYLVPDSGKRTYWTDPADPWVKHWFNISGPLVVELLRLYSLEHVHLIRNFSRPELFTDGLARLRRFPAQAHLPLGPEIISSIFSHLASDVLTEQASGNPVSPEGRLLRDFLEKRIFSPMPGLDEMSKILHLSPVQTIRVFRKDFNETPYQYLLRRKLIAAQELLHCTERPIKQIAADLCFSNEYYFAGFFKRRTGYAPGQFRRISREGKVIHFDIVENETEPGGYVNRVFDHSSGAENSTP